MSTQVMSANENFNYCHGSEQIFINSFTQLKYTEGVREIAVKTESFWFLDLIASYQPELKNEPFQVWKLQREFAYQVVDGVKKVIQRKDVFNVVCEDGNDFILKKQRVEFSDFPFDIYVVWRVNGICLLPGEY